MRDDEQVLLSFVKKKKEEKRKREQKKRKSMIFLIKCKFARTSLGCRIYKAKVCMCVCVVKIENYL